MAFKIKLIIAIIFDILGISNYYINSLKYRYDNQYIRILNYHNTIEENNDLFEKQLQWYSKYFSNVTYHQFEAFMDGEKLPGNKPGLMITFDDGLKGNYEIALPLLEKYGFTGYFFCSSDFVGTFGYMDIHELKELIRAGHVVGNHTATHHRMLVSDTEDVLNYEIVTSRYSLEKMLDHKIDIFCWCGGEEEHYTSKAHSVIKESGYKYAFLTNSYPVTHDTDRLHIQRINIEDSWPICLVKLQICGFMDKHFEKKRERVNAKLS